VRSAIDHQGRGVDPYAVAKEREVHVTAEYFAWPSRRIAQVARRFDEAYGNGSISSICRSNYSDALRAIVNRIQTRFCP
jgi:hypothetical protein